MPLLIIRVYILHVATFYLIHPYPSHILIWDISFCFILSRTNPVSMCESHFRPPGPCLFTTSPSHEWFIKPCITIMTHCLSLFLGDRLSGVDKWLEFQNNTNISKETFCFMDNVFRWVVAFQMLLCGQCHVFVFKCLNIFLMCLVTGRLLFAKIRDWNESSFSCSKKKTKSDKQHSRVFL